MDTLISINPHGHFKCIFFYPTCNFCQAFLDVDGSGTIFKNPALTSTSLCLGKASGERQSLEWVGQDYL